MGKKSLRVIKLSRNGAVIVTAQRRPLAGTKHNLVTLIHFNSNAGAPLPPMTQLPHQRSPLMARRDRCNVTGCSLCCSEGCKNITRCFQRSEVSAGAGVCFTRPTACFLQCLVNAGLLAGFGKAVSRLTGRTLGSTAADHSFPSFSGFSLVKLSGEGLWNLLLPFKADGDETKQRCV